MTLGEKNIRNYYNESVPALAPRPALQEDLECDVAVVGAGIAGCSTALHLAERGYRVVLLEGRKVGFGASGRSGAQLIFGYACGQEKIEKLVGQEAGSALWQVTADGLELVRDVVARYGIDCELSWGQLHVAVKERQRHELREEAEYLATDYGYDSVRFLDRDEVRSLLATGRYCGALHDANSGHCHPLKYTRGLAAAAERAGATVFESTPVTAIDRGPVATLHTPQGRVRAKFVALAGNTYLEGLVPELQRKIMAVGTYIVATEPLGRERAEALIRDNLAVADVNFVLDYFRLSADHRLLFGGRVSYSGLDPLGTERATRARMLKVFPQLADARIDYAWGGYVDITVNRAPHFGRLGSNVYFLQGFSGHGMALTGIAGKLVAEAIAGQSERFDLFERIPHMDFPGGMALRRPALVLGMLWYRMRDLL
jgi:gamma-glutamylputrescine oxidase